MVSENKAYSNEMISPHGVRDVHCTEACACVVNLRPREVKGRKCAEGGASTGFSGHALSMSYEYTCGQMKMGCMHFQGLYTYDVYYAE